MDTTDPDIDFDGSGVCCHCRTFEKRYAARVRTGPAGKAELNALVDAIRASGRGKRYDCVIGVSGGVDSTYVAHKVVSLGLRPLAVHLDNGWDSNTAVSNIEKCLRKLNIDLHTEVLDWEEFRDLQVAFLRASTPDSEIPTDHAIGALMLHQAAKHGLRYVVAGQNVQTEGMGVKAWSCGYHDWRYIRGVSRRFGRVPLRSFPHYDVLDHVTLKLVRRIRRVDVLNFFPYNRAEAQDFLIRELGWQDYGGKHHESIYTRFFQSYILPTKFHADKRRFHLSSLVASGQTTREEALAELSRAPCTAQQVKDDLLFVTKKLGLTVAEFEDIMRQPPKCILDYPSYETSALYQLGLRGYKRLRPEG